MNPAIPFRDVDGFRVYPLDVFNGSTFDLVIVFPENSYRLHRHVNSHQEIYIVSGQGRTVIGGQERNYGEGDYFFIPKNIVHCFYPRSETGLLSISTPPLAGPDGNVDVQFA